MKNSEPHQNGPEGTIVGGPYHGWVAGPDAPPGPPGDPISCTAFRREYRIIERANGEFLGQSRLLNNGEVYQEWMCPYHPDTPRSTLAQAKDDLDNYIRKINGLEIARVHPYCPPKDSA